MLSSLPYRLVQLANGSYSVHSLQYGETFHPVVGPVAEAETLYVRQLQLRQRLQAHVGEFVIWDVGLGAAANATTVLRATQDLPSQIRLVSFDQTLEPLEFALNHSPELGYLDHYKSVLQGLLQSGERVQQFQNGAQSVSWELRQGHFPSVISELEADHLPKPHAILFDAYSPAVNPEMWTQPLFARLFRLLNSQRPCALPTYSRSTLLRVTLLLAGFFVGKGDATGAKEETTIASNSLGLITDRLDAKWLKRVRNSTSAEPLWEPVYRQAPLSDDSWEKLNRHPQFANSASA